jgi:hypothetical protein
MCLKQRQGLVVFDNIDHVIFNGKAKFTIKQSTSRKMKLDQSNHPIIRKLKEHGSKCEPTYKKEINLQQKMTY